MSDQLVYDDNWARQLEAIYEIEDARRRRSIVRETLAATPGERIADIGCGPGFYCAELADEVGSSGSLTGVDESTAMLELARGRCADTPNVAFHEGSATHVPLPDAAFDAAISVQVLEYVADVDAALAELHRILRPGGRVLVWDIDWATLSVHSEQHELTARVLRAWDEHLAHRTLPRTLIQRLRAAGFEDVLAQPHPMFATEYDEGRRQLAALVPFIAKFVAGRQGLTEADAQVWVEDQRGGDFYAVTTQVCFTARRS